MTKKWSNLHYPYGTATPINFLIISLSLTVSLSPRYECMSSSASTSWNEVDVEGGSVDQNSNSEALLTSSIDDTFTEKQVSVFNSHLHYECLKLPVKGDVKEQM